MRQPRTVLLSLPLLGLILVLAAASLLTRGASSVTAGALAGPIRAIALLYPTAGSTVEGKVTFTVEGDQVKVIAEVKGLTPGKHGFHIHEFGDCSGPDGMTAGGHFNPATKPHGAPDDHDRHAGDLGNLVADANGYARLEWSDPTLRLDGEGSILGRGVIVHVNPDDFTTQPTGNAGGRLACGVIGVAK
jgi:Cu-Zn family superoxide dismutase